MKIYIDSANINEINELNNLMPIDGVTTNPSIICKENRNNSLELLKQIREILRDDQLLFTQVIEDNYDKLIDQAYQLLNLLGKDTVIKIPVTFNGLKAIQYLEKNNINTLATAVFHPQQTNWAAKAGAKYVAPYVNRIDHHGGDGIKVVKESLCIIKNYDYKSEVVAASFKNTKQLHECALIGTHSITASPNILKQSFSHLSSSSSVAQFQQDWIDKYGSKKLT
ncbi:transaldolase family protein [Salipaludibacillus daqingensis]|uniref:transaldolase family protein n=1 Tax=Salipaludibacillus daqingensis TaxID=3041001 RepID=UPI002474B4B2|nr:transaldolase family protein [Salipaludibacillus daqingensis]